MSGTTATRTERIIAGLAGQNDQAEFEDQKGFWVQGDAVFIAAESPQEAIEKYRHRISAAQIGINHNFGASGIRRLIERMNAFGLPCAVSLDLVASDQCRATTETLKP